MRPRALKLVFEKICTFELWFGFNYRLKHFIYCPVHNEKALACICWRFCLTIMTVFGLAVQMVYVSLPMAQTGVSNSLCHLFQPISEPLDFKAMFPLIWRLTADFPVGMQWIRTNTVLAGTHFGAHYVRRYRFEMTLSLFSALLGL